MKKIKIIATFFLLIFFLGCGYSPLLETKKINFYISDVKLQGDRQTNNYILNRLKNYQNLEKNLNKYDLLISSSYEKVIANRDSSGNPKNYNLKMKVEVTYIFLNAENNKVYERTTSLSAQNKKIDEKKLEEKYKKNLSDNIAQDIIFYLKTK